MTSMCAPGWSMIATEGHKAPGKPRTSPGAEQEHGDMATAAAAPAAPPAAASATGDGAMAAPTSPPIDPMQLDTSAHGAGQGQVPVTLEQVLLRTASFSSSNSSGSGGGCPTQSQWGSTSTQDVTWGTSNRQHHASAASSARASSAVATQPRPGAPLTRTGSGCKRPLSASSSSSSLAEADAQNLPPQEFLHRILRERGYETEPVPADKQVFFQPPTPKQIKDYDLSLINAVKAGDMESLRQLAADGRQMDACNRHGESIVHISCRRGQAETLRFLLQNGGRVHMCDDLGRTPLHDACWAKTPVFDCISTIMDQDPALIRVVDCRGASPLAYIRREHWPVWRQFFDSKKDTYWKPRRVGLGDSASTSSASSVSSAASSGSLAEEAMMDASSGVPRQLSGLSSAGGLLEEEQLLPGEGEGAGEGQGRMKRVRSTNRLAANGGLQGHGQPCAGGSPASI